MSFYQIGSAINFGLTFLLLKSYEYPRSCSFRSKAIIMIFKALTNGKTVTLLVMEMKLVHAFLSNDTVFRFRNMHDVEGSQMIE